MTVAVPLLAAAALAAVAVLAVAATGAPFEDMTRMHDGPSSYELFNYNPVANSSATVIAGNARFTVLTDRLVRMEYVDNSGARNTKASASFEDRPTLAFLNRRLPVPSFTHHTSNGVLTITTKAVNITYQVGKPFSRQTLIVTSTNSSSSFSRWQYGDRNDGNLLGTIKSLDLLGVQTLNCTKNAGKKVHDESLHCEWGLVSRDGWALVNDSDNWALTKGAEWWSSVNADTEDLYLFAHGRDYTGALADYVKVGGSIPMVPRYATGVWFTRWYDLNNVDVRKYIADYQERGFPLDVFVFDMNWHTKYHWGGYTPDPHLLPYVHDTFDFLNSNGLHTAGNLHDDDGVHNTEERFVDMCKAMGLDPTTTSHINFSAVNSTYVYAVEDVVLQPLPFDFWWIDWQQGGTQGGCAGGKQNPTIWTDKIRVTTPKRQGRSDRGLVLARWGGLGNHRYQVGFSGDVAALSWKNLAYQPYFSMTASNVGYGFWSHDTEGPPSDLELYVRWVQWSSFSAVMRSHDRGMSGGACVATNACAIVRPWNVPRRYYEANKAALVAREELIPYIYTAYRQAFDTGVSILRPMYYSQPEQSMAYRADENGAYAQYMFGDDLLVAPVVTPADKNNNMAKTSVWLPAGKWVERDTGVLHHVESSGGHVLTKSYDLSEIPIFVRGGAIVGGIPVRLGDTMGLAQRQYTTLVLTIYPGANKASTKIYEDDGSSVAYLQGEYVWTHVSYMRSATSINITINSQGTYKEFPTQRKYIVRLVNNNPVRSASVNGQRLSSSRFGGSETFSFDGNDMVAIVETGTVSTNSPTSINLGFDHVNDEFMSGLAGMVKHATLSKRNLDEARITPGAHNPIGGNLMSLSSAGEAVSYLAHADPSAVQWKLQQIPTLFSAALDELENGPKTDPSPTPDHALTQMFLGSEEDHVLCGTLNCLTENSYYTKRRVEGYMPRSQTPFTTPLFLYWNGVQSAKKDNLVTTAPQPPSGYEMGDYQNNGQVFTRADADKGLVPLQLWYKDSISDHMTLATNASATYAKDNGYKLVNGTLGYVYAQDPYSATRRASEGVAFATSQLLHDARANYSIDLLKNAVVH